MNLAIYAGSFDPVTLGHIDIIEKASKLFDKIIVAIPINPLKKPIFTTEERMSFLNKSTDKLKNIEIISFDGLLVDYAKRIKANILIRGLRTISDFDYEFQTMFINKKIYPELETIFLTSNIQNIFISSSAVKQVGYFNGDISEFVPKCIEEDIRKKLYWRI